MFIFNVESFRVLYHWAPVGSSDVKKERQTYKQGKPQLCVYNTGCALRISIFFYFVNHCVNCYF